MTRYTCRVCTHSFVLGSGYVTSDVKTHCGKVRRAVRLTEQEESARHERELREQADRAERRQAWIEQVERNGGRW